MHPPRRPTALFVGILTLVASPVFAERAEPLEATVFIRLFGQLRVLPGDDQRAWREQLLDLDDIEVATGSGYRLELSPTAAHSSRRRALSITDDDGIVVRGGCRCPGHP